MQRRGWIGWALGAYGLLAAVVLLGPWRYADIVVAIWTWLREVTGLTGFGAGWVEFVANVVMFVPLGLLLTLFFRHPWVGFALALVMSTGVELVQQMIPGRVASPRDVLANAGGAAIGALVAWLLIMLRRSRERARMARE